MLAFLQSLLSKDNGRSKDPAVSAIEESNLASSMAVGEDWEVLSTHSMDDPMANLSSSMTSQHDSSPHCSPISSPSSMSSSIDSPGASVFEQAPILPTLSHYHPHRRLSNPSLTIPAAPRPHNVVVSILNQVAAVAPGQQSQVLKMARHARLQAAGRDAQQVKESIQSSMKFSSRYSNVKGNKNRPNPHVIRVFQPMGGKR
ncbi:hypothetical protein SeMB42_g05535 [Synchytrium endobioticum]|uniref:Uncharacterized protein n=1 Tax=Synchytrium endobioticum TaxID=286115 RepID=A0A507CQX6_9FUNG|nr:hypothetical protein SeLEV6574_g06610 [Synchytrium endobioticum]TPX41539.1 hypothetical protein SeMB42_g05535 [Synchytrium endobioticum]